MQKNQFGIFLIVALVALRVVTGTHFFREGVNKLRDPRPFSAGFFENATGPFAASFHHLVWDRDGLARLNQDATIRRWDQFQARVEKHFGFDEAQRKRAERVTARYEAELKDHMASNADELREYRGNLARRDQYSRDRQRRETPSLQRQTERIESEIRTKRPSLVNPLDAMWRGYARDVNAVATSEQRKRGVVRLEKPERRVLDTETIDAVIPWFDATVGLLLIMGLFTRPAAVLGAAFLLSVAASQWPMSPTAVPTWPQIIEALGLLVVAAAAAGRYAGFDALLRALFVRRRKTVPTEPLRT